MENRNKIIIMEDMMQKYHKKCQNEFESKFKKACLIWGVDLNNHEEIKKRCVIVQKPHPYGVDLFGYDEVKEFHIDGKLVMMFTDWKIDPINPQDPFKMSMSFRCSEIIKPNHAKR